MKMRFLLPAFLLMLLAACGGESVATVHSATAKDSIKADDPDSSTGDQHPPRGVWDESNEQDMPQKSKAEKKALEAYWARASAAESAWLRSERLDEWAQQAEQPGLNPDEDQFYSPKLSAEQVSQLTAKEAVYYCIHFPEYFYQNCDEAPPTSADYNIISPSIRTANGEKGPSERQSALINNNRKEISDLMVEYLKNQNAVSAELLQFIAEYKLVNTAPELMRIFQNAKVKDHYLLSVLLQFMNAEEFPPLITSAYYPFLFEKYRSTIAASDENVQMILTWAHDWLLARKAKGIE